MNRRKFIRNSAGIFIPSIFIPRLIRAQAFSSRDAAFIGSTKPASGAASSTLLTSLAAYYKLEDVNDSGINAANLTNHGTVTFITGKVNNAANFVSTSSQYLDIVSGTSNQFGTGNFSFTFWFKTSTVGVFIQLINKGGRGANSSWYLEITGGQVQGNVTDSGGNQVNMSDAAGGSNNNAYHLVVVTANRAGNLVFYLDNVQKSSNSMAGATGTVSNATGLEIGGSSGPVNLYDGLIDECGLWSKVLSSTEITNLWNGGTGITYPFTGF